MIANRLKELRKSRGLTLDALGELVGTTKQTIHRYESGAIANIPPERVEALARALDTTPAELMGWEGTLLAHDGTPMRVKRLPVLGEIACGVPIFANEERESFIMAWADTDADFCLIAKGDSMTGARIYDGDIVFIRSQDTVEGGEIAAVIIGDEATLKRVYYYPDEQKLILSPENTKYSPLVYVGEELSSIKILGKAVAFQSSVI